jgi:hypothetical protein
MLRRDTVLIDMLGQIFRGRAVQFRARSSERDRQTDAANVALVAKAISEALRTSEAERAGLARRVADALSRAAVTVGNGVDEYIDRDDMDTRHLNGLDSEIQSGQSRLLQLDHNIAQFEVLTTELERRFPGTIAELLDRHNA